MNPRADQEIAIAKREAERVRQERESRWREHEDDLMPSRGAVIDHLGRRCSPNEVPIGTGNLRQLLRSHRLVTNLRKAAAAAAERTGLEPVEAAKLSECHELLVEVVT